MAKPHNPAGNAGKGRVKGSHNKMTILAREAIQTAFDELGGVPALVAWAQKSDDHRKVFYSQIWTKVLPLQVSGAGEEGEHVHKVIREIVRAPHQDR